MPESRERVIVLIDGEHHPSVVADALTEIGLADEIVGVAFCGGGEKAAPEVLADPVAHYGYPLIRGEGPVGALMAAIELTDATRVIDLADEPVVDAETKLRLAARAQLAGLIYDGPGMEFEPEAMHDLEFDGPKISVIGTGKRTGKTAVAGHLAVLLARAGAGPVVVSMGRGGPPTPTIAMPPITLDDLLTRSRTGDHAASDYLEDALLANVPTVGSRRVGGGPGGQAAYTNFYEGAQVAAGIPGAGSLIFEGSGAVIPPVRADKVICVLGPGEQAAAIGGPARMGISDLVLTPAGDQLAADTARRWARERVVEFELRTETVAPIPPDSRVAFFSTGAPPPKGLEVVVASTSLARREDLASDVVRAIGEKCDLFLTELKAAAIDVVAESAAQAGIAVEFVRNRPVAGGSNSDADLDEFLFNMYKEAAD